MKLQNQCNRKMPMWTFPKNPKAPGTPGASMKVEGVPSGGNNTLVSFSCDDCAAEAGRVAKAGGKIYTAISRNLRISGRSTPATRNRMEGPPSMSW
jgi:predicted enzyme related to lactoylglutathione lyase